jgi:AraC-like DNA-binding protein
MIACSPSVTHASTEPVPPDDRLAYWDTYNAGALIGLHTSSLTAAGLVASQTNATLSTMCVAEIKGNEHAVERSLRLANKYPKESIFACHLVKGSAYFLQGGVTHTINPFDTIIYDTRRPFTLGFPSAMHEFLIEVPVSELEHCWGISVDDLPLKIPATGRVGAAIGTQLRRTLKDYLHAPTPDESAALPACTHTLLRSMVQSYTQGSGARYHSMFHILAAKMYIARRLGDQDLSPAEVASKVGVSVRHLNRLFASDGASLSDYMWRQRTNMAYLDLVNQGQRYASVGEIAFRWGFSSQAHFCRAISGCFGAPPTELRKAANLA